MSGKKIAKILVMADGFPSDGYVSWPQRLEYLTQQFQQNEIDIIICGDSNKPFNSLKTKRIICKETSSLNKKIFPKNRFKQFENALLKIVNEYDDVIVCVVDSVRIKNVLYQSMESKKLNHKIKWVYYNCGFSNYHSNHDHSIFSKGLSDAIMLSKAAYEYEFQRMPDMPFAVHVLHNPIDHSIFKTITDSEKDTLKKQLFFGDGTHFIWVSHDKPVKGLSVILAAWRMFFSEQKNASLHIVGATRDEEISGVIYHGKVPNKELPKWYQASDICIFSPLRNEGYGLALAEAISCGCFCVATYGGGAKDFFIDGKHGIAIPNPNFLQDWANAFDKAMIDLPNFKNELLQNKNSSTQFFTYDEWCKHFLDIFSNIEKRIN